MDPLDRAASGDLRSPHPPLGLAALCVSGVGAPKLRRGRGVGKWIGC